MLTKQILEAQPGKLLVRNLSEKLVGIAFVVAATFLLVLAISPTVFTVFVSFFLLVDFSFLKMFRFFLFTLFCCI